MYIYIVGQVPHNSGRASNKAGQLLTLVGGNGKVVTSRRIGSVGWGRHRLTQCVFTLCDKQNYYVVQGNERTYMLIKAEIHLCANE